jgi:hypothetical protein
VLWVGVGVRRLAWVCVVWCGYIGCEVIGGL